MGSGKQVYPVLLGKYFTFLLQTHRKCCPEETDLTLALALIEAFL